MKTLLMSCAISAAIGAGVAYINTADHYEAKARALLAETAKAEQVRADKAKEVTDELFEKWKSAIVAPDPVTVTRIVRVKADASVCADQGREMDHDRDAYRITIDSGVIREVERVALKHESLYKQCAVQLRAAQALLSE